MTHVRFGEVSDRTDIHVERVADNDFFINLGFLQDQHIYAIHVPLPVVTTSMERSLLTPEGDLPLQSVTVKTKDEKTELELEVKLDGVHGQVQSRITLDGISPSVSLVFRASVLKSHDGTPSLKSGISIVARLDNDDSSSVASGAPVTCK